MAFFSEAFTSFVKAEKTHDNLNTVYCDWISKTQGDPKKLEDLRSVLYSRSAHYAGLNDKLKKQYWDLAERTTIA